MTTDTFVIKRRNGKKSYCLLGDGFEEAVFIYPTGMKCLGEV